MLDHTDPFGHPESGMLGDIVEIADRALWNPAKVSHADIQKLAAAVVAHVRRLAPERKESRFDGDGVDHSG